MTSTMPHSQGVAVAGPDPGCQTQRLYGAWKETEAEQVLNNEERIDCLSQSIARRELFQA